MAKQVAIVGAGRVGKTLARLLRRQGWRIGAVVTRSPRTARAAVRVIGAGRPMPGIASEVLQADVVLISTPDREVAAAARSLAKLDRSGWRGKIVLHTSGALGHEALAPLARCGAATGSMHPMQTFSGRDAPRLEGVLFAIEGDPRARRLAARLARALGGAPFALDARHKPGYHAAGAFVAGHVLAITEAATRILLALGFSRPRAVRALLPLVRQTLDNFEQLGPRAAWTGPLSRGDYPTVTEHVWTLHRRFPREYAQAYVALTRLGARLLRPRPAPLLRRLRRILGQP